MKTQQADPHAAVAEAMFKEVSVDAPVHCACADRHKQPVCRCATLRVVTAGVESGRARCDACGQMWASMDAPIRWLGSGLNSLILLRGPDNQAEILEYVGGSCRSSKELFIDDMIGPDKQLYIWRDKPELGVFYRLLMVAPRPKATPW